MGRVKRFLELIDLVEGEVRNFRDYKDILDFILNKLGNDVLVVRIPYRKYDKYEYHFHYWDVDGLHGRIGRGDKLEGVFDDAFTVSTAKNPRDIDSIAYSIWWDLKNSGAKLFIGSKRNVRRGKVIPIERFLKNSGESK